MERNPKTQRLRNTFNVLAADAEYWDHYNSEQMIKLREQVDNMTDKYSDTKIKDIDVKRTKYGTRYIKNALAPIRDFASSDYKMYKYHDPNDNTNYYRPWKLLSNEYDYES